MRMTLVTICLQALLLFGMASATPSFGEVFNQALTASGASHDLHRRCADTFGLHAELEARGIARRALKTVTTTVTTVTTLQLYATATQTISPVTTIIASTRTLYQNNLVTTTTPVTRTTTRTVGTSATPSASLRRGVKHFGAKAGNVIFDHLHSRDVVELERACRQLLSGRNPLLARAATTTISKRVTKTSTKTAIGIRTVTTTLASTARTTITSTLVLTTTIPAATRTTTVVATATASVYNGYIQVRKNSTGENLGYLTTDPRTFNGLVDLTTSINNATLISFTAGTVGITDSFSITQVQHGNASEYDGPLRLAFYSGVNQGPGQDAGDDGVPTPNTTDLTFDADFSDADLTQAGYVTQVDQFRFDASTKIITQFWQYRDGSRLFLTPAAAALYASSDPNVPALVVAGFANATVWLAAAPEGETRIAEPVTLLFQSI